MKKILLLSAIALGIISVKPANAQVRIGVNINLGGPVYAPAPPPPPAPVEPVMYDDDYYYLPEVEAYYSVTRNCYHYYDGYAWVSATYLPGYYRNYDWRTARRYVVHANRPYLRHDTYRGRFGGYTNRDQYYSRAFPNRDSRDWNRPQRDNRGDWNRSRGNDYNRDRQNGYNQGGRGSYGQSQGGDRGNNNWGQQGQPGQGRGNWNQQRGGDRDDNRDRGNRNEDRGRGGFGSDRDDNRDRGNRSEDRGRGGFGGDRFAGNRPGRG